MAAVVGTRLSALIVCCTPASAQDVPTWQLFPTSIGMDGNEILVTGLHIGIGRLTQGSTEWSIVPMQRPDVGGAFLDVWYPRLLPDGSGRDVRLVAVGDRWADRQAGRLYHRRADGAYVPVRIGERDVYVKYAARPGGQGSDELRGFTYDTVWIGLDGIEIGLDLVSGAMIEPPPLDATVSDVCSLSPVPMRWTTSGPFGEIVVAGNAVIIRTQGDTVIQRAPFGDSSTCLQLEVQAAFMEDETTVILSKAPSGQAWESRDGGRTFTRTPEADFSEVFLNGGYGWCLVDRRSRVLKRRPQPGAAYRPWTIVMGDDAMPVYDVVVRDEVTLIRAESGLIRIHGDDTVLVRDERITHDVASLAVGPDGTAYAGTPNGMLVWLVSETSVREPRVLRSNAAMQRVFVAGQTDVLYASSARWTRYGADFTSNRWYQSSTISSERSATSHGWIDHLVRSAQGSFIGVQGGRLLHRRHGEQLFRQIDTLEQQVRQIAVDGETAVVLLWDGTVQILAMDAPQPRRETWMRLPVDTSRIGDPGSRALPDMTSVLRYGDSLLVGLRYDLYASQENHGLLVWCVRGDTIVYPMHGGIRSNSVLALHQSASNPNEVLAIGATYRNSHGSIVYTFGNAYRRNVHKDEDWRPLLPDSVLGSTYVLRSASTVTGAVIVADSGTRVFAWNSIVDTIVPVDVVNLRGHAIYDVDHAYGVTAFAADDGIYVVTDVGVSVVNEGLHDGHRVRATLAPNPAGASTYCNVETSLSSVDISLHIYDLVGERVKEATQGGPITILQGATSIPIDLHDLASGMYILELRHGNHRQHTTFVRR